MSPQEYVNQLKYDGFSNDVCNHVLTTKQKLEAREVLDAGYNLIGQKMGQLFDEMTPEAVQHMALLQQFLLVFIEHTMNPALVKKMPRNARSLIFHRRYQFVHALK